MPAPLQSASEQVSPHLGWSSLAIILTVSPAPHPQENSRCCGEEGTWGREKAIPSDLRTRVVVGGGREVPVFTSCLWNDREDIGGHTLPGTSETINCYFLCWMLSQPFVLLLMSPRALDVALGCHVSPLSRVAKATLLVPHYKPQF